MRVPADRAFFDRYGSELSVGLAQRVLVSLALLHQPSLLIADEPTSALDLVTQAELLALFRRLRDERGMAMLFISHDLMSVAAISRRVAILHEGRVVEAGPPAEIFMAPRHPFTRELVAAMPRDPFR